MSLIRANQNVFYGFCYDARADPIVAPSDSAILAAVPEAPQQSGIPRELLSVLSYFRHNTRYFKIVYPA